MSSINIKNLQEQYPDFSDKEIAEIVAAEGNYVVVVKYKSVGSDEYNNFGLCQIESEVVGYKNSPYCNDVEIIYDARVHSIAMNEDLILMASCELCDRDTTEESLTLMGGNDFYYCPKCGTMYCDSCYPTLPLTSDPGYGMCIYCRIQVKRALPGTYGV